MKHFFTLIGVAVIIFCHFGCSSEEEAPVEPEPTMLADETTEVNETGEMPDVLPLADTVVLENMYTDEAERLADETPVQIVTVLQGSNRVTIEARFRGVRDFGLGFPIYECELMSEEVERMGGIAAGMSGSPVGPPGRVMGALAYGNNFSTAPTRFWVTAIDAMESGLTHQTFDEALAEKLAGAPALGSPIATYAPVKTPLMVTGIKPHRLQYLAGFLKDARFDAIQLLAAVGDAPAAPAADRDLIAGDMIGVAISTGDVVNAIGFGTVTQVYDDNTFIAFGHPFSSFGAGKTAHPVYRAVVNGLVPNLQSTYKSTSATGDPIGTIHKDLIFGIVGELGVIPEMIQVNMEYHRDKHVTKKNHEVAYGEESFISLLAALTFDAIRLETSPSTINLTLELHFKETDETYTETFLRASNDTFFDLWNNTNEVISAFTDPFSNTVEKATLTSVDLTIREMPEIQLATLHEVSVTEPLMRGETATVSIVLLPHWSAVDKGARKIEKSVSITVPRDFSDDSAWLSVVAKDPDDFDFDFDFGLDLNFDFDFDAETEDEDQRPPENLDELITQMTEQQAPPPGKITVILSDDPVHPGDLIFDDDPQEEIILEDFIVTGSKQIFVQIEGN